MLHPSCVIVVQPKSVIAPLRFGATLMLKGGESGTGTRAIGADALIFGVRSGCRTTRSRLGSRNAGSRVRVP